jgi:hypothetical protein
MVPGGTADHATERMEMLELARLRELAEAVRRNLEEEAYEVLPARRALEFAHVALKVCDAVAAGTDRRWLTLEEVMHVTGRDRKFFTDSLKTDGDRSRLEVLMALGLADQTWGGQWLVSPAAPLDRKPGYVAPERQKEPRRAGGAPPAEGDGPAPIGVRSQARGATAVKLPVGNTPEARGRALAAQLTAA